MKTNMPADATHVRALSLRSTHARRRWGLMALLYVFSLSASCRAPDNPVPATAANEASAAEVRAAPMNAATIPSQAGIPIDLSFVDKRSDAYERFREWVDSAAAGHPGYAFSASDAALMHRHDGAKK